MFGSHEIYHWWSIELEDGGEGDDRLDARLVEHDTDQEALHVPVASDLTQGGAQPLEGRSLVPAFDNKPIQRDALYWEHEGNAAIRVGDMKLVRLGRNGPWELSDLKADRTELHNLANEEIARKMMRPPFSWYRLHEYDVPAGKLPRYVLEYQDEDYTEPKAIVWEVLVTIEPCDVESDYLCIRLEK